MVFILSTCTEVSSCSSCGEWCRIVIAIAIIDGWGDLLDMLNMQPWGFRNKVTGRQYSQKYVLMPFCYTLLELLLHDCRNFIMMKFYMYDWLVCIRMNLLWLCLGETSWATESFDGHICQHVSHTRICTRAWVSKIIPFWSNADLWLNAQTTNCSTVWSSMNFSNVQCYSLLYLVFFWKSSLSYPHALTSSQICRKVSFLNLLQWKERERHGHRFCKAHRLKIWGGKACMV